MDAVSGKLQEAFGISEEWHAPRVYSEERVLLKNVETAKRRWNTSSKSKTEERIEDLSDQWSLCE